MSINLTEIQQKVDRLLYNIAEQNKKAYTTFFDPTPQTVELPQLDENGNLVTVELPNRALIKQQMWDDFGAAIGQMSKTLYVDAVNGSDDNPGTSDAPLKTVEKAIEAVPTGGWVKVILRSNAEITKTVLKDNITVVFIKDSSLADNPTLTFTATAPLILAGNNNRLWFKDINFVFNIEGITDLTPLVLWSTHEYLNDAGPVMGGGVGFSDCNISVNADADFPVVLAEVPAVKIMNVNISYSNTTGDYFAVTHAGICRNIDFLGTNSLTINGNASDFASHIYGIVRDANGTPRNILSNLVL